MSYSTGSYSRTVGATYSTGGTRSYTSGSTVGQTYSTGQTYTTGQTYSSGTYSSQTQSNYTLTDTMIQDAYTLASCDNRRGGMDAKEMSCAVIALGFNMTESECAKLMSGSQIGYAEFAALMRERSLRQDDDAEYKYLFNLIDQDKTGKISFQNLKSLATLLEEDCSDEVLREMIGDADILHKDGEVDYAEFLKIMRHSRSINGGYYYSYPAYSRPIQTRTVEIERVEEAEVSIVAIRADGKGELYTDGGDSLRAHASNGQTGSHFEVLDGSDASPNTAGTVVIFGNGTRSIAVNPNNASAPLTLQPQTQVGDREAVNRAFEVKYEREWVWFRSIAHPDHWLKVTSDNRLTLVPRAQRDNSSKFWMRMV